MPKTLRHILQLFATCLLFSCFTLAWAELPPAVNGKAFPSLAPMLKNVMPTVVNVSVTGDPGRAMLPFDNDSGDDSGNAPSDDPSDQSPPSPDSGNMPPPGSAPNPNDGTLQKFSLGSGVIIDADKGYIVTNAHVIHGGSLIRVTLNDGRQYNAKVIGSDPDTDIAVLQIHAKDLHAITFSDSNDLQVGDFVVAIGNPFGLNQSVTSGIVSALKRTRLGLEGLEDFIQTDAPINPGNSGGALVNLKGQLVGINTAILTSEANRGSIGIGFAIPANMAKSVTTQLIKYGSVRRGLMGVMVQSMTPGIASTFNLPNNDGAVVTMITPNSPAAKAGFKPYDVITKVNGSRVSSAADVSNMVGLMRVGSKIDVEIMRDGKPLHLSLVTASPKAYRVASIKQNPFLYGMNLMDFSQYNALHGQIDGVQVVGISPDAPAQHAMPTGLLPGDVIISANRKPVKNVADLKAAAADAVKNHQDLLLNVLRDTGALFVVIK